MTNLNNKSECELTVIICRAFLTKLDVRLPLLQCNNHQQSRNTSAKHSTNLTMNN